MRLIRLTLSGELQGERIDVNPDHIITVRPHWQGDTFIRLTGEEFCVMEDQEEVRAMVNDPNDE